MNNHDLERLRSDLELAAKTLRRYEELHRLKGTTESLEKARVNMVLAARFEATLSATPTVEPARLSERDVMRNNLWYVTHAATLDRAQRGEIHGSSLEHWNDIAAHAANHALAAYDAAFLKD